SPASGTTFNKGVTTVSCSASDTSGNTGNCTFTVTVTDNVAPVVTGCANVTANSPANTCSVAVTYTQPTATDNCDGSRTVTCSPASGTTFNKGVTTVSCSATDTSNNTGTVTCPANISFTTPGNADPCGVVTYATPSGNDNCGIQSVVCSPASGTCFPVGMTTVTCTATDTSGNTGQCSFKITVQNPCAITCPANITKGNDPNQCGAVTTFAPM